MPTTKKNTARTAERSRRLVIDDHQRERIMDRVFYSQMEVCREGLQGLYQLAELTGRPLTRNQWQTINGILSNLSLETGAIETRRPEGRGVVEPFRQEEQRRVAV